MINPDLLRFLERWKQEWSSLKSGATPAEVRAHFEGVAANMKLPTPEDVDTSTVHRIGTTAGEVRVRVIRHKAGGTQPCLVYMHGGAWMQGSPETHAEITERLASWAKMTVVSVDYDLAPEHIFPTAHDQVSDVVRWVFENAETLGVDADRISVGGDSVGGNLAASACLDLREEVNIRAQLLIYPPCDFDFTRQSYIDNPNGPVIKPNGTVEFGYFRDLGRIGTWRASPLLAESHAGLPPAFIAVGEHDPLRDSGRAYAEALEGAGVPVTLDQGAGMIHGYLRAMDFSAEAMAKLRSMAGWLVERNTG